MADHGFMTSPNFDAVNKSVRKRCQQHHAHDVRGLVAFCFCPLEEKVVNKSCFCIYF